MPIGKRMDRLLRPFPTSPAEVLATTWPTFGAPSDVAHPALRGHQRGGPTAAVAVAVVVMSVVSVSVSVAVVVTVAVAVEVGQR